MLSNLKDLAAGAMKSVSGQFASAAGAIADLAASLANRAAAAADLGRILDIIDMVPGVNFDKPELDADYLNTLLVAVQMGELTLAVHYRQQTEASVVRLHPIAAAEANAQTASDSKFSSKILVDGEGDKPAIQMLVNIEHLAKNYRHVSADTLINALAFPIENVKGGFIIVKPFRAIARPIAGWLLNIIFDQGENCTGVSLAIAAKINPNYLRRLPTRNKPTRDVPYRWRTWAARALSAARWHRLRGHRAQLSRIEARNRRDRYRDRSRETWVGITKLSALSL